MEDAARNLPLKTRSLRLGLAARVSCLITWRERPRDGLKGSVALSLSLSPLYLCLQRATGLKKIAIITGSDHSFTPLAFKLNFFQLFYRNVKRTERKIRQQLMPLEKWTPRRWQLFYKRKLKKKKERHFYLILLLTNNRLYEESWRRATN